MADPQTLDFTIGLEEETDTNQYVFSKDLFLANASDADGDAITEVKIYDANFNQFFEQGDDADYTLEYDSDLGTYTFDIDEASNLSYWKGFNFQYTSFDEFGNESDASEMQVYLTDAEGDP